MKKSRQALATVALLLAATFAHAADDRGGLSVEDLELNIFGFVMADTIYDFKRVDPDWNDTLRVSTIPTRGEPFGDDGEWVTGVRQSRIAMEATYPTSNGNVRALLEYEWFGTGGDAGQTTPRLRHAWAEWKTFGVGQYWSNFMDAGVFPNTIDYWGPTGMVFYRNQQMRYWFELGDDGDVLSFSLEDPDTALSIGRFRDTSTCDAPTAGSDCGSSLGDVFQAKNDLPDFTARYKDNRDWGYWQVAGIARKLGYERVDISEDDEEYGFGINLSTVINLFERDQLKLQLAYGEGIGNYFNDGGLDIAPDDADIDNANAEPVEILGIVAYYDRYWNDKWSSSIGWSMTDLDDEAGQRPTEFKKGQYANVNLLHYPTEHVMMGAEFVWGEREDVDGEDADDYRVQFSVKVNFSLNDLM